MNLVLLRNSLSEWFPMDCNLPPPLLPRCGLVSTDVSLCPRMCARPQQSWPLRVCWMKAQMLAVVQRTQQTEPRHFLKGALAIWWWAISNPMTHSMPGGPHRTRGAGLPRLLIITTTTKQQQHKCPVTDPPSNKDTHTHKQFSRSCNKCAALFRRSSIRPPAVVTRDI